MLIFGPIFADDINCRLCIVQASLVRYLVCFQILPFSLSSTQSTPNHKGTIHDDAKVSVSPPHHCVRECVLWRYGACFIKGRAKLCLPRSNGIIVQLDKLCSGRKRFGDDSCINLVCRDMETSLCAHGSVWCDSQVFRRVRGGIRG